MYDILEVIKNIQTISENNSAFKTLKDFERVIDELNIYVYKNWEDGELILGPKINRYTVECTFMWSEKHMPDPQGAKRLAEYGCEIFYKKDKVLIPRKVLDPEDFRPGTKKGKIDAHPVWTVTIIMPKKLMQDVYIGRENADDNNMAELMKYSENDLMNNIDTNPTQETTGEENDPRL